MTKKLFALLEVNTPDKTMLDQLITLDLAGADACMVIENSHGGEEHEAFLEWISGAVQLIDLPLIAGGHIKHFDDIKKYLYAGLSGIWMAAGEHPEVFEQALSRFGPEKVFSWDKEAGQLYNGKENGSPYLYQKELASGQAALVFTANPDSSGIFTGDLNGNFLKIREHLALSGFTVSMITPPIPWEEFKQNEQGLIPVILQDYQTDEVLMLAYMNEEAFRLTCLTGKMHYYSRSRKSQWLKGETSGHFQYVKKMLLDCDNDTLLVKIRQIGAACHTGSPTCFFQQLFSIPFENSNPENVLTDVYRVITDRKQHPKEGSYTNYLFNSGLDKILKKVGEEAAETLIASAKGAPNKEITYEISDLLYHLMVLMAEKGIAWDEVMEELANR